MKTCRICAQDKPLSEFQARAGAKDGHRNECRECNLARQREYLQRNREVASARARARYAANRELVIEARRRFRAEQGDRINAARRARYVPKPRSTPADRFWERVQKTDDCWLWTGSTDKDGYGWFWVDGKTATAHRFSYALHNDGAIPDGLYVCHSCDNPPCVNPDHLWLGTNQDNMDDCARKGRRRGRPKRSATEAPPEHPAGSPPKA